MFNLQNNYWIWILIAFFLLSGNNGCGDLFGNTFGNIFGCGTNSWWIWIVVAYLLLGNRGLAC